MSFFDFLFPPRVDEIVLRGISDDEFLAKVAPRLVPETRPGTVALLPFNDASVRAVIHEAKYHGNERAFKLLALALADYLRDMDERPRRSFIVPVPLGVVRRKERGFNQAEEISKRAAKLLGGVVDTTLLVRTRETISQISLAREKREENMRGAFRATRRADPSSSYIIIDDVITTGATLQAAIDALLEAGALHIIPLALAH
ncbi:MAG TPA: hypothetical protein VJI70_01150 [Candidatus Paceibacterota bacterium]